jgi:amino acid transporter
VRLRSRATASPGGSEREEPLERPTHNPGDIIGGWITIALLAALNIRGLGESVKLNVLLAIADLCTQVLLVGVGAVLVLNPSLLLNQVHLGTVPSWTQVIFALSVAMVAYTGIETVSNMAEEAKDPGHDIPKSVNLVLLAVLGVYAGISVVALSALPVVQYASRTARPSACSKSRRRRWPGATSSAAWRSTPNAPPITRSTGLAAATYSLSSRQSSGRARPRSSRTSSSARRRADRRDRSGC